MSQKPTTSRASENARAWDRLTSSAAYAVSQSQSGDMFYHKKSKKGVNTACIFVHAGAGYHSVQNEGIHLGACVE